LGSLVVTTKSKVYLFKVDQPQITKPTKIATQTKDMTIWCARYNTNQIITTNQKGEMYLYSNSLEMICKSNMSNHPILTVDLTSQMPGMKIGRKRGEK
jgi:hypothetical protein